MTDKAAREYRPDKPRIEAAVREILIAVGEDPDREGLRETPARVARMYAELFGGLHADPRELLQKKFAGTTWAAQTPYWFDCMNQEWPDDPNAPNKVTTCKPKTWPKQPRL